MSALDEDVKLIDTMNRGFGPSWSEDEMRERWSFSTDTLINIRDKAKEIPGHHAPEQIDKKTLFEFWQYVCLQIYEVDKDQEE